MTVKIVACGKVANYSAFYLLVLLTMMTGLVYYWNSANTLNVIKRRNYAYSLSIQQEQENMCDLQHAEEQDKRLQRYRDVCSVRKRKRRSSSKVYFYRNQATKQSLSMCSVPKAGCTFWARIFQFLNRTERSRPVSSHFDITRFDVYYHPIVKLRPSRYDEDKMADALRFFFVRDPYTRLVSAYVDKFILPQFMSWSTYGRKVARFRGHTSDEMICLDDLVTFEEFIHKIVFSGDMNGHWRPIHTVCDPCKLFPHIIGKQETFTADAKHVLEKVGLGYLMTNFSHSTYVEDEIRQMVDFTFALRNFNQYLHECYDDVMIAERIWLAFHHNGYIPSNIAFPEEILKSLIAGKNNGTKVREIVTDVIVQENARAGMSRDQHSKQKRNMLVKQYNRLSRKTMFKLADMYDFDFKLFGYEKYPNDLFS